MFHSVAEKNEGSSFEPRGRSLFSGAGGHFSDKELAAYQLSHGGWTEELPEAFRCLAVSSLLEDEGALTEITISFKRTLDNNFAHRERERRARKKLVNSSGKHRGLPGTRGGGGGRGAAGSFGRGLVGGGTLRLEDPYLGYLVDPHFEPYGGWDDEVLSMSAEERAAAAEDGLQTGPGEFRSIFSRTFNSR